MAITIYYDITRLVHRSGAETPTGIDRVDINYVFHFNNSDRYLLKLVFQHENRFYLVQDYEFILELYKKWLLSASSDFDFLNFKKSLIRISKTKSSTLDKMRSDISLSTPEAIDGALLDDLLRNFCEGGFYINTSHHGVGNTKAYRAFKILGRLSIIFYLHDIIPIDYPEYVRVGDEVNHAKRVSSMAEFGDLVIVNSKYTQERFIVFCNDNCLKAPETLVLHIGIEEEFLKYVNYQNKADTKLNSLSELDYFVYISTIEPRKNHLLLLHLWRNMILEDKQNIPKLVIIGKRGWNNQNILDLLDRSTILKEYVIELSDLTDAQMVSILQNSKALLYPSFVEGWGMPIVEAVTLNVPVVCSDILAHRESGQEK